MTRVPRQIGFALAVTVALASAAAAEDLTPERLAALERDERAALDQVDAAHGRRPPREMPAEERAEMIRQQQDASRAVFERHGVDPKEYAVRAARLTPEERDRVDAEKKRLDRAEAERLAREAAAQAEPPAPAPEDVEVIRGINEANPVELHREEGGPVEVENLAEIADQAEEEEAAATAPERAPHPRSHRRR